MLVVLVLCVVNVVLWRNREARASPPAISAKPTLHVAIWEDYVAPRLIETFQKNFRCTVKLSIFEESDQLLQWIRDEGRTFDVIVPSTYIVPELVKLRAIEQLNHAWIPNIRYLDSTFMSSMKLDDLLGIDLVDYGVPFVFAQTGIAYRKSAVEARVGPDHRPTWAWFDLPTLAGRRSILGERREAFAAALLAEGLGVNEADDVAISKATKRLRTWHDGSTLMSKDYAAALGAGTIDLAHAYPGDVLHMSGPGADVVFAIPREGGSISIECLCVGAQTQHSELAHQLLNYLLAPDVAATNMEWTAIRAPNPEAFRLYEARLGNGSLPLTFSTPVADFVLRPLTDQDDAKLLHAWEQLELE
ncbi:MAG: extracellular solute-binding protein [Planctomycetes bacterium]|nr:extracellular solute-binding protein [Planctomycetota bacterium]